MTLAKEIREYIIAPALKSVGLWSESAEILVYGTGMVETGYNHIVQIGTPKNGGVGIFQTEPSDLVDIVKWLNYSVNNNLKQRILAACYYAGFPSDPMALAHNFKYATLMCRLHYLRCPDPLPSVDKAQGFAAYHKKIYNSSLGAANVSKNTEVFEEIINGRL